MNCIVMADAYICGAPAGRRKNKRCDRERNIAKVGTPLSGSLPASGEREKVSRASMPIAQMIFTLRFIF